MKDKPVLIEVEFTDKLEKRCEEILQEVIAEVKEKAIERIKVEVKTNFDEYVKLS